MHAWVVQEFERRVTVELERIVQTRPAADHEAEGMLQAVLRSVLIGLARDLNADCGRIMQRYSFRIEGLGSNLCPTCFYQMPHSGTVHITLVDAKAHLHPDDKLWEDRECWGPEVQYRGGYW